MFRRNLGKITISLITMVLLAAGPHHIPQAQARKANGIQGPALQTHTTRPKPDLVVAKVTIDSNCRIKVVLRNQGSGRLPKKIGKLIALRLFLDKHKPRDLTFKEIDPKGVLAQPGAELVYTSPRLNFAVKRIKVIVDPDNLINETTIRNNRLAVKKPWRPCKVAKPPTPPLVVHSTYLHKGVLHVRLLAAKKAKFSRRQLQTITLKVRAGRVSGRWPLSKVDAKRMLRLRSRVDFNTRLKVKPGAKVSVTLAWPGGKREKSFTLSPPASRRQRFARLAGPSQAQRRARLMSRVRALAARPAGSGDGRSRYFSTDSGIHITLPREGQEVPKGSTLRIRYRFLRRTGPGPVTITLLHTGSNLQYGSITTQYRPSKQDSEHHRVPLAQALQTFDWQLPPSTATGSGFAIMVRKGDLWSIGEPFTIVPAGEFIPPGGSGWEIRLVNPGRAPSSWPRGSTQTIAWRVTGDYPQRACFVVKLMRGNSKVMTIPQVSPPVWHGPSKSYSMQWTIPTDLPPASDYSIKVAYCNDDTEGKSQGSLAITGPIEVLYPPGTRYMSNPTLIRWRIAPNARLGRLRVALVNEAGDEVILISNEVFASNDPNKIYELPWVVGANRKVGPDRWEYWKSEGAFYRGNYAIRVSDSADRSNYGQSQYFWIGRPTIRVWTTTSNCFRGLRIRWEAPELHESVRLKITARHCAPYGGSGTICVSNRARPSGGFCWKFGDSCDGLYSACCNLPCPHARIWIWPVGFGDQENIAAQSSEDFELKDTGCDDGSWAERIREAQ